MITKTEVDACSLSGKTAFFASNQRSDDPVSMSQDRALPRPSVQSADDRTEPRFKMGLPVRIWGRTSGGDKFAADAVARDVSVRGALLVDVNQSLRCGDLVGLCYNHQTARFRVVWTCDSAVSGRWNVALQRVESDLCPWAEVLQSAGKSSDFSTR